jgi:hypothetical protein
MARTIPKNKTQPGKNTLKVVNMQKSLTRELLDKGLGDLYTCFLRFGKEDYTSYKFALMEHNFTSLD